VRRIILYLNLYLYLYTLSLSFPCLRFSLSLLSPVFFQLRVNKMIRDLDAALSRSGDLDAALGRSGDLDAALLCFFSFFRFFFFSRRSFLPSAHTPVSD